MAAPGRGGVVWRHGCPAARLPGCPAAPGRGGVGGGLEGEGEGGLVGSGFRGLGVRQRCTSLRKYSTLDHKMLCFNRIMRHINMMNQFEWKHCTTLSVSQWCLKVSNHEDDKEHRGKTWRQLLKLLAEIYPGRVTHNVEMLIPDANTMWYWCGDEIPTQEDRMLVELYAEKWKAASKVIDDRGTIVSEVFEFAAEVSANIRQMNLFPRHNKRMAFLMTKRVLDAVLPFPVFYGDKVETVDMIAHTAFVYSRLLGVNCPYSTKKEQCANCVCCGEPESDRTSCST